MTAFCAYCKTPVDRLDLIAGLCRSCLEVGAPIPLGESDTLTRRNLTREGRVKRDATPVDDVKRFKTPPRAAEVEGIMSQARASCRYCGKDVSVGNKYNHEHKSCPKRPDATPADAPKSSLVQFDAKRPVKRATSKALVALPEKAVGERMEARDPGDNYCDRESCVFRGLSSHISKVRVEELVRGGLHLEDAARFVREHCV